MVTPTSRMEGQKQNEIGQKSRMDSKKVGNAERRHRKNQREKTKNFVTLNA